MIGLIVANIIPLYILVGLGFIAGRWLDVNLHSMAIIAMYILAPMVNFGAIAQMKFTPEYVVLPMIIFVTSAVIGIGTYLTAHKIWKNNIANLIGMSSVSGNTMYFGLPVVLALLGPEWVGVYVLMNLGIFLNEIGLGYFFGARGHASVKGALLKVVKFPVIHAIWLGFLYNISGVELPESVVRYWNYAIGAWVLIGMMLIGVALSKQSQLEIDWKLCLNLFVPKFLVWPMMMFGVVIVDVMALGVFAPQIHQMLVILGAVPLLGNLVAYAATLKLHAEKAAAAVLISTIMAFFTVPAAIMVLQWII